MKYKDGPKGLCIRQSDAQTRLQFRISYFPISYIFSSANFDPIENIHLISKLQSCLYIYINYLFYFPTYIELVTNQQILLNIPSFWIWTMEHHMTIRNMQQTAVTKLLTPMSKRFRIQFEHCLNSIQDLVH